MSTSFPPILEHFVQNEIASGRYQSEDALLCDAVRLLRARKLHKLREEVRVGLDQLEQGEAIDLENDEELAAFFDEIESEVCHELRAELDGAE